MSVSKWVNFGRVKNALKNIEKETSYYVGGTLFIDFKDMPCIGINLTGRGFSYSATHGKLPSTRFLVTREMHELVKQIYLRHKGRTEHYESTVKG